MNRSIKIRLNLDLDKAQDANLILYLHSVVRGYAVNLGAASGMAGSLENQLRPLAAEVVSKNPGQSLEGYFMMIDQMARQGFEKAGKGSIADFSVSSPEPTSEPEQKDELFLEDLDL